MKPVIDRRMFLKATTATGCALCLGGIGMLTSQARAMGPQIISPGCRRSKVKVAKIYLGIPKALWPTPKMDLNEEMTIYEAEFLKRKKELSDVEFVANELITSPEQAAQVKNTIKDVDGILAIHLSMGVMPILKEILIAERPTILFAAPYSGHEWTGFGALEKRPEGALLNCMLTSDFNQLAVAIRPFRAIHHLREAKILNVTERPLSVEYVTKIKAKFGTEIKQINRQQMLDVYNTIDTADAETETNHWIERAEKIVEPNRDEIFRSCKLALAFQKLMDTEDATVITVDCYGTMYRQLPAFPCIGFTRLNDFGLGGICESDLRSAMTFMILQGLSGKPGFISDPTVDESRGSIILAHCLGSTKMDGPDGLSAPYKIRTIMERQEGAVAQVKMRVGEKVTQAILIDDNLLQYFTGVVIDAPDIDRGCRTKIDVKVDGSIERLWQNWSNGLHRVTCYGNIVKDLERFCKFKNIKLVDEA